MPTKTPSSRDQQRDAWLQYLEVCMNAREVSLKRYERVEPLAWWRLQKQLGEKVA